MLLNFCFFKVLFYFLKSLSRNNSGFMDFSLGQQPKDTGSFAGATDY